MRSGAALAPRRTRFRTQRGANRKLTVDRRQTPVNMVGRLEGNRANRRTAQAGDEGVR